MAEQELLAEGQMPSSSHLAEQPKRLANEAQVDEPMPAGDPRAEATPIR